MPNKLSNNEISLHEALLAVKAWRWKIAAITVGMVLCGVAYILVSPKVYRADALVQVDNLEPDRQPPRPDSITSIASDFRKDTTVLAEIAVIRSRTLLGGVVDQLHLDLVVRPSVFPLMRHFAAPIDPEDSPVDSFSVPAKLNDKPFTLTIEKNKKFSLYDEHDNLVSNGTAGSPLAVHVPGGRLEMMLSPDKAVAGKRYTVVKRARISAINDLQLHLKVSEEGERSGVIRMTLEGEDRELARKTIRAIVHSYEDLHTKWRSSDVDNTLAYLEKELPKLEKDAKNAERHLSSFQEQSSPIDISSEGAQLLNRSVQLETGIAERKRELDQFTPLHPGRIQLEQEIADMTRELGGIRSQIRRLPRVQEKAVDLTRSANVAADLYAKVLKNVEELRIIKSSDSSSVRVIDAGDVLLKPVKPNIGLIIALTTFLGLFTGIVSAIIPRMRRGISDSPDSLERLLGLPVYATLPYAPRQRTLEHHLPSQSAAQPSVLALQAPMEIAVEGLRGLRTWLNTGEFRRSEKGLLITGPIQGVGKTFVSINLAAVLAAAGRRVLLIDADLRKGNLHRQLKLKASPGLTDLLSGETTDFSGAVQTTGGFYCITKGVPNPASSELLMNGRFAQLLALAYEAFDDVIIDSSPVLAVSDSIVIGQLVGSALLVVRAGINKATELLEAKKRLEHAGVPLRGVVFNGVDETQLAPYVYRYTYNAA